MSDSISGVVVQTAPEHLRDVLEALHASGLCEVHFHDAAGRIVVTLEGADTGEGVLKMKEIMNLPHVLSAGLAYSCSEELHEAPDRAKKRKGAVPDSLKE